MDKVLDVTVCCQKNGIKLAFDVVVGFINYYIIYYFCLQLYRCNYLIAGSKNDLVTINNNTLCLTTNALCVDTSAITDEILLQVVTYSFRLVYILNFICIWSSFTQVIMKQFKCDCRRQR